jgi:secreted trypsin-like serine protease
MNRTILAATIVVAAILCLDRSPALVGADLADRTIQRYTVVVRGQKARCTGVVLAQNIVLTAAHCIPADGKLWVGGGDQALPSWLLSTVDQSGHHELRPSLHSAVDQVVQHPLFSPKDKGSPDLAILKLAKPLPDSFMPAVLGGRPIAEGDNLIAAGFGKTSPEDARPSKILRMVLLKVTQASQGWVILKSLSEDDRAASAAGDSGGPLFAYRGMHSLVGLIAAGNDKQTRAVALAAHYSWIKETQEKLGGR